jgi:ribonucleoside-diphosphate reductase alpha chain
MTQKPLPPERPGIVHKFVIGKLRGYIRVSLYDDGTPGEIFVDCEKVGSTERGLLRCLAVIASVAIQHGVPWEVIAHKLSMVAFEPAGFTGNKKIPQARSVADYIGRWLLLRFGKEKR